MVILRKWKRWLARKLRDILLFCLARDTAGTVGNYATGYEAANEWHQRFLNENIDINVAIFLKRLLNVRSIAHASGAHASCHEHAHTPRDGWAHF